MTYVLTNATLASLAPRRVEQEHIVVTGTRIESIGGTIPVNAEIVDCRRKLVVPGNVCAHTHLYSTLARGMPGPKQPPRNFPELLERVWWRLDRALDADMIRSSASVGALDAARAGTTTLIDHHSSPNCIGGSLDVLADSISEVGVRAVLCYEVTDRGGRGRREAGLEENARFLGQNKRDCLRGLIGAHASFTLEDETLGKLAEMAQSFGTGVHIHLAEDICDQEDSVRRTGKPAAIRLADAGILGRDSIGAHGVHLNTEELRAIHQLGSWLVHNCRSNLNNGVGRAPVLDFGARAALGTDGIDGDMFAECRTAFLRAREDTLNAVAEHFTDLLAAGANLISEFFPYSVGTLEPEAAADLVILDYDPPTPLTDQNLAWHWMFALNQGLVGGVIVNGEWVIRNREFCRLDEERIRAAARAQASRLWEAMESL